MRIFRGILSSFLLFITAAGCSQEAGRGSTPSLEVVPSEFAGVEIGMTVSEASQALNEPLENEEEPHLIQVDCYFAYPGGQPGSAAFMIVGDIVVRIDVDGRGFRTRNGIGVGNTELEVQRSYKGDVEIRPHPFMGPPARYLVVNQNPGMAIIFETDGEKVVRYRAGALPYVEWIEGCS